MLAVCGAALCENVEGSFLCLCASDLEEYDAQQGHCRPRVAGGKQDPYSTPRNSVPPLQAYKVFILFQSRGGPGQALGQCGLGCRLGMEVEG